MLAEDVGWVDVPRDVGEGQHLGCHGFSDSVKGEHGVSLVEFGMDSVGAVHNRLVVAKHVARITE